MTTFAYIGIGIIVWLAVVFWVVCIVQSGARMDRAPRGRRR